MHVFQGPHILSSVLGAWFNSAQFAKIDKDGSGSIELEELRQLMDEVSVGSSVRSIVSLYTHMLEKCAQLDEDVTDDELKVRGA